MMSGSNAYVQCRYCTDGNWLCFGDVYLANRKLSSKVKCQSCAILRKPCVGGIRFSTPDAPVTSSSIVVVPPSTSTPPPAPQPRRQAGKAPVVPSSSGAFKGMIYDKVGVAIGSASNPPTIDLTNPVLNRKRSALGPPSTGVPSSSKVLRPAFSSSAIRRTSSAHSSSPSLPSPLVFSPSLPMAPSSSMVVDPPEDQILLLLDALEFAIERGNLEDVRMRIRALRKFRRDELQNREG